ncbi:FHA domain-containing protein [Lacrimispora sphenoides]|uniref:FHA domain-containing protein n=1 Tax=Lacrimispora sphenoides JCM 1415 TaxID=1297793 RepID=A0ABY1C2G5_9FIRM|nr:FHA domain-containing protein [Lacrimispora sphenoides]SET56806.1 FHA domain-containing protein [[Clostridium] sphenoides JCM 1415]SUY49806.1 FHA domain-containing protein [Lacrimispora sphenoides]
MNQKRMIDLEAAAVWLTLSWVTWSYPNQFQGQRAVMWAAVILTCVFLVLALKDRRRKGSVGRIPSGLPTDSELITELVLLSEEDKSRMVWELYGKTTAVIGRDVKENHVDVDLSGSSFASMVDIEHAVLNFSSGNWYVEDLGSANGISVRKAGDGRLYRLSADTPCRLDRGDCLYVGLNRLLLR